MARIALRLLPALFTGLVGVAISALSWSAVTRIEEERLRAALLRSGEGRVSAFRAALYDHLNQLEALGTLQDTVGPVDQATFHHFGAAQLRRLPGVWSLEWAPRVPAAERAAFEERERRQGRPAFRITEYGPADELLSATPRDVYYPIQFQEPVIQDGRVLGLDLGSNAERRAALEQARDQGELTVTARVVLVTEPAEAFSVLVFRPVYRRGLAHDSTATRRANLVGFAVAVVRIKDLLGAALHDQGPAGLDTSLYDLTAPEGQQLLHGDATSSEAPERRGPHHAASIDVGGRRWLHLTRPTPTFLAQHRSWLPFGSLVAGLALTAALTGLLLTLTSHSARVERQVAERTAELRRANQALRETTTWLTLAQKAGGIATYEWDITSPVARCSDTYAALYGLPRPQTEIDLGEWFARLHPEDRPGMEAQMGAFLRRGGPYRNEYRIVRPDGDVRWLADAGEVLREEGGRPGRVVGVVSDITESKREEVRLRQRQERLQRQQELLSRLTRAAQNGDDLLASLGRVTEAVAQALGVERVGFWRFSPDRRLLRCLDLYEAGPRRHCAGQELHIPDYPAYFRALESGDVIAADDARADPRTEEFRIGYLEPHGITSMLDTPLVLFGRIEGTLCNEHVGPARVWQAEEKTFAYAVANLIALVMEGAERRRVEEDLQNFFALSIDGLCVATSDGHFRRFSPFFSQTLGYTEEELRARPFLDFVHPDDREATRAAFTGQHEGQSVIDFENRYRCKDGGYRWLQWRGTPLRSNGLIYAVARDVTDSRRLMQLLELTNRAARVGGWDLDLRTNRLTWTEETYRIHEVTPEEYTPTLESAIAFYAPEHVAHVAAVVERARATGEPWQFELQIITGQGRRRWVHAVGTIEMEDGQPARAAGSFQDIHDRKMIEEALRASERALRQAHDELERRVIERTAELRLANEKLVREVEERRKAEMTAQRKHQELESVFHALPDLFFRLNAEGTLLDCRAATPADLYAPPGEVLGRRLADVLPPHVAGPAHQAIREALHSGTTVTFDYPLHIGGEERSFEARMVRLSDQEVIVVVRDVTQRKRAEARLHASLQEKEALLKEVHHRVKNNLQIISSLLTLQADQVTGPGALEVLRESRNRVRSMAQIHETLYRSEDLSRADFAAYIESLGSQLFRSYAVDPGRVRWHAEVAPVSLDLDRAIPCGLILNELISNALKHAFPEGRSGEIVVRLYASSEGMYTLVVSDNGVGLPDERGPGLTGSLGLQLVATLARQLRGRLDVERQGGTTFRLTFPA